MKSWRFEKDIIWYKLTKLLFEEIKQKIISLKRKLKVKNDMKAIN